MDNHEEVKNRVLRRVDTECCGTCKHSRYSIDDELICTVHLFQYEPFEGIDADPIPYPIVVDVLNICDQYEAGGV